MNKGTWLRIIAIVFVVAACLDILHIIIKSKPVTEDNTESSRVNNFINQNGVIVTQQNSEDSQNDMNAIIADSEVTPEQKKQDSSLDIITKTDDNTASEASDLSIISFSRKTAGYIKPADSPRVDPSRGFTGMLVDEEKTKNADLLLVGQEVVTNNISFTITRSVFSEKEGNFADSNKTASYCSVYVVLNCDIENKDSTSPHELAPQYSFNLIVNNRHLFTASSVEEKEYYSFYSSIAPNTQIKGATISFNGSRSLLTWSNNIIVELLCENEPIAYWKIEPSFVD